MDILDFSKTLAESALQLMYASKEGGGNPKSLNTHDAIMDASSATKEAIDDLLKSVQEAPEALVSGMVDSISNSVKAMDSPVQLEGDETFANYQSRIMKSCKALVKCTSDMSSASNMMSDRPEQLQVLVNDVLMN